MKLQKAKDIAKSKEFSGDMRVGFLLAQQAAYRLNRRVEALEKFLISLGYELPQGNDD